MRLKNGIVVHVTEDAKKKWEQREKPIKRKNSCPSCEIENMKKEAMFCKEEIPDDLLDNDYQQEEQKQ
ncbi:MAG: hypothetical protein LBK69_04370 [Syntrophomonadaceae bacterium]|jgi:hypothetical protein|nr:hypothetical protein [Syntrophomonadaceae bacterium]